MKRKARPLVGVSPVVALALRAEDTPSSPQVADPSCAKRPREPPELTSAVVQALAPAIARGLGFDLQAAVRARLVRLLALHTVDGRPLPSDWAIPILPGEVVVACAALRSPLSGVAALVVRGAVLPRPKLDLPQRERIARALADALLAELKGHTT
jgi:hypothetical protein